MQIPHAAAFAPLPSASLPGAMPASPMPSQQPTDEFNFNPYQSPTVGTATYGRMGEYGDARLASLGARLGGSILDGLVGLAAVLPGLIYMGIAMSMNDKGGPRPRGDDEVLSMIGPLVLVGIGVLAITIVNWVMISQSGQSIGKKIVGTRIVRLDGTLPGFGFGVAMRNWVPGFISNIPYLGFVFAIANILFIFGNERRCIHDYIAGTRVVEA